MAEPVDKKILKGLIPANALKAENFEELAGKTFVETVASGKTIFKEGDHDKKAVYVIEGQVEILSGLNEGDVIVAEGLKKVYPRAKINPIKEGQEEKQSNWKKKENNN